MRQPRTWLARGSSAVAYFPAWIRADGRRDRVCGMAGMEWSPIPIPRAVAAADWWPEPSCPDCPRTTRPGKWRLPARSARLRLSRRGPSRLFSRLRVSGPPWHGELLLHQTGIGRRAGRNRRQPAEKRAPPQQAGRLCRFREVCAGKGTVRGRRGTVLFWANRRCFTSRRWPKTWTCPLTGRRGRSPANGYGKFTPSSRCRSASRGTARRRTPSCRFPPARPRPARRRRRGWPGPRRRRESTPQRAW